MCSVSVLRKGGNLDPSRHEVMEENVGVGFDESSEPTGVRSSATVSLVAPNPAAVPCGRAALAGG